ncbi:MAG: hypothetical protein NTV07_06080, partial [Candidatus Omnitrophica bacterium]|nr:hypothetical protein [Candidatus Omnitrophota bacterium]
ENPLYAEARRLLEVKKIKTIVLKEGDMIGGFDSVKLRVLNPPADKKFSIPNDNSLVIRLDKGNFSALLCGDIMNEAAKNLLLTENENLGSIFLKVPHHGGSMGDIAGDFLMKINPKAALISARGKKVDSHILLILKELGTKIYSTDINGAVSLETENNNWRIRQFIQN